MAAMVMPTTTTTNVLWTQLADGDVSIAAVNAVVGNLLGAIVAPLMASLLIGSDDTKKNDIGATMWKMCKEIIIPFTIGIVLQLILHWISERALQVVIPIAKLCLQLIMV